MVLFTKSFNHGTVGEKVPCLVLVLALRFNSSKGSSFYPDLGTDRVCVCVCVCLCALMYLMIYFCAASLPKIYTYSKTTRLLDLLAPDNVFCLT